MTTQQQIRTATFINDQTLSHFEKLALVIFSSGLLILSSKTMVPFYPIPITLQGLAVISLGIILGPRLALAATLTYLAEGAAGFPVFADSISYPGLAVLAKPSAGFLMSFPIAAFTVGYLAEKGWTNTWTKTVALFLAGYAIMYSLGMAWLISFVGADMAMQSMFVWLPGDIAKIGLGVTGTQLYIKIKK